MRYCYILREREIEKIYIYIFIIMSENRKYVALTANLPNWIKWMTGGLASAVAEV